MDYILILACAVGLLATKKSRFAWIALFIAATNIVVNISGDLSSAFIICTVLALSAHYKINKPIILALACLFLCQAVNCRLYAQWTMFDYIYGPLATFIYIYLMAVKINVVKILAFLRFLDSSCGFAGFNRFRGLQCNQITVNEESAETVTR